MVLGRNEIQWIVVDPTTKYYLTTSQPLPIGIKKPDENNSRFVPKNFDRAQSENTSKVLNML